MKGKGQSVSLDQPVVKQVRLGGIKPSGLAMGLALLVLAAATAVLVVSVIWPGDAAGIQAGLEASAARWTAMGEHYAPDYEVIAEASTARWVALGEYYANRRDASSARWQALGEAYAPDYEAIAEVSTARWKAIAEWYAERGLADN